jgi:hypothetical protein
MVFIDKLSSSWLVIAFVFLCIFLEDASPFIRG